MPSKFIRVSVKMYRSTERMDKVMPKSYSHEFIRSIRVNNFFINIILMYNIEVIKPKKNPRMITNILILSIDRWLITSVN